MGGKGSLKNPKSHYIIRTCAVETKDRQVLQTERDNKVPSGVWTWKSKAEQSQTMGEGEQRRCQGSVRGGIYGRHKKDMSQFYRRLL